MHKLLSVFIIFILTCLVGCGDNSSTDTIAYGVNKATAHGLKPQLNITLLLDLSDRINPQKYPEKPEHFERDLAIIKYFAELFVSDMTKRGTYMSKGKLKVMFSPKPNDPNINLFAEKLNVNLNGLDVREKKEIYDNLIKNFTDNAGKIYSSTIAQSKWVGSDLWRFFKNDVRDYCVERDSNYRNILVILTDGYIYHIDSKDTERNKYAYLTPELIANNKFRNNPNWSQEMENKNFGLIAKRDDLSNLEVLVLEISPSPKHKNDEDIIKAVMSKWFKEMNVKRYALFNTDLPDYTKKRIDDFIN